MKLSIGDCVKILDDQFTNHGSIGTIRDIHDTMVDVAVGSWTLRISPVYLKLFVSSLGVQRLNNS